MSYYVGQKVKLQINRSSTSFDTIKGSIRAVTKTGRITVLLETGAEQKFNRKLEAIGKPYLTSTGMPAKITLLPTEEVEKEEKPEESIPEEPIPVEIAKKPKLSMPSRNAAVVKKTKNTSRKIPPPNFPPNCAKTHNDIDPSKLYIYRGGDSEHCPIKEGDIVEITGFHYPFFAPKVAFWGIALKSDTTVRASVQYPFLEEIP